MSDLEQRVQKLERQNRRLQVGLIAMVALAITAMSGCGGAVLTDEIAHDLIAEQFALSEVTVDGLRETDTGYVVRATVGGFEGQITINRYDSGWRVDGATADGGPDSLTAWRLEWGSTMLEPFNMGVGERKPTDMLVAYVGQVVDTDSQEIQIRLGNDQLLVIEGDNLDLLPFEVDDAIRVTARDFVADPDDSNILYPFSSELPAGVSDLFNEDTSNYLTWFILVSKPMALTRTEVPYRRDWESPAPPGTRMLATGTLRGTGPIELRLGPSSRGRLHRDSGHDGETVTITRRRVLDDGSVWYQMKRPGGLRAWAPEANIRIGQ